MINADVNSNIFETLNLIEPINNGSYNLNRQSFPEYWYKLYMTF
jgi:hypothetical protein